MTTTTDDRPAETSGQITPFVLWCARFSADDGGTLHFFDREELAISMLGDCSGTVSQMRCIPVEAFCDLTIQLAAYANNVVLEFQGPGRQQAAYVRDGVVATCERLRKFVEGE